MNGKPQFIAKVPAAEAKRPQDAALHYAVRFSRRLAEEVRVELTEDVMNALHRV